MLASVRLAAGITVDGMQSTYPGNMPDLIHVRSGSALKRWPETGRVILAHRLASGPDLFGPHLTQSVGTKLDLVWLCTAWSRMSVEERNWVWKGETGSGLVAFCQKIRLASRPDAFGQTMTRPSRSVPGQFCTVCSMPSLEKRNGIGCGKSDLAYMIWPDSGCMLAVMAITKMFPNWIQHVYWVHTTIMFMSCYYYQNIGCFLFFYFILYISVLCDCMECISLLVKKG